MIKFQVKLRLFLEQALIVANSRYLVYSYMFLSELCLFPDLERSMPWCVAARAEAHK